ncbi:hypothetical protein [Streptomyces sp. WG5]|uniref:hypothetical protein n=1 Tax=Streptomyces sp. WG5 TaxID=3417648 RepID=UPI003CF4E2A4
MAETSYPFAADSAGGGGKMVSQVQWQAMSHLWGPDRIDFQLTAPTYQSSQLPFDCVISGSDLVVQPGSSWNGGFYYKLDAPWTHGLPTNSGALPRKDLIVIRTDMSTGSVNLAIVTGQAASAAPEPAIQRVLGGIWETPIWCLELEANNGARLLTDRRRFDVPSTVSTPWWRKEVSDSLPVGSFTLDLDTNNNSGHEEGYRGLEGDMITRTLGKRRKYTPDIFTVNNKPPAANRTGSWRIIAPGLIHVSIKIRNTSTKATGATNGGWVIATNLPVPASNAIPGMFQGFLDNPEVRDGLPNFADVKGKTTSGGTTCYLYLPSPTNGRGDLDGLRLIPGRSTLELSGTYETNVFD